MNDDPVSTTIEILGKPYPIRCKESELASLQEAAGYLNTRMQEVQESGKAINFERIAMITALNIAHQYLQLTRDEQQLMEKINQKLLLLQEKVDAAIAKPTSDVEFLYAVE